MDVWQEIQEHRDEILKVAAKHGAVNLRIFGSVARGDARVDSDLDILVDLGPKRSPFFPGGLLAELEELLHRKVDIVTANALHWYIRDRVLQEAKPL